MDENGAAPGRDATTRPTEPALAPPAPGVSRRRFLRAVGRVAVVASVGVPAVGSSPAVAVVPSCSEKGPLRGRARRNAAYELRIAAADQARVAPLAEPACSGDDDRYPTRLASYAKGLPHDRFGDVDLAAYTALLTAIDGGRHELFEVVPMGGTRRLVNPQAATAYAMEGADSHDFAIAPPPAFDSAARAAEMAELYWMALTRDVPFASYATDPTVARAAEDLSRLPGYAGPREGTAVTARTLFRGTTPGEIAGPFLSQFLAKDIPAGPATYQQKYRGAPEGSDFLTSYPQWLSVQRGDETGEGAREAATRYIRNARDLAEWVHRDYPAQAGSQAAMILMEIPGTVPPENPYAASRTQDPFCTFGRPFVLDLVSRVANAALRAAWYQKWALHRTSRPEAYGGRVHNHVTRAAVYPIHPDLLVSSTVLPQVRAKFGTYLLPQAYAEGSPLHPAFPSGHATFAGATVTVAKALFDESAVVTNPVVATADGSALVPYTGATLTVGNELNKLAANVAFGRCMAGVHYRSDAAQGLLLGEAVATRILREIRSTLTESFSGFTFTRFDGTTTTV